MGIDATLFGDKGQKFYYDREYNLRFPLGERDCTLANLWSSLSTAKEGISKSELRYYLSKLICVFIELSETKEDEFDEGNKILWATKALRWTISLPNDCKIISRNDTEDEYFELSKSRRRLIRKRGE